MGGRGGGVAGLAAALVLAGCTAAAEPQAKPLPPLTKSPSASASPSPAPRPSRSPVGPTPTSAAAFVRAYYAAVNQAAVRGTADGLARFSTAGCSACLRHLSDIASFATARQHLAAPPYRVLATQPEPVVGNLGSVTVTLSRPPVDVLDQAGRRVSTLRTRPRFYVSCAVAWTGSSWRITDILDFQ